MGVGVGGVRVDTLLGPEGTRERGVVSPGWPGHQTGASLCVVW